MLFPVLFSLSVMLLASTQGQFVSKSFGNEPRFGGLLGNVQKYTQTRARHMKI